MSLLVASRDAVVDFGAAAWAGGERRALNQTSAIRLDRVRHPRAAVLFADGRLRSATGAAANKTHRA